MNWNRPFKISSFRPLKYLLMIFNCIQRIETSFSQYFWTTVCVFGVSLAAHGAMGRTYDQVRPQCSAPRPMPAAHRPLATRL